ncbi:hypothetical protein H257_07332 [Aphanomyces astaci]|uniref:Transmembrane protein 135 N-terminal domain-containing protein n=1 Tax=Aphanomyces astaci TaxID=112090 RepID=W4GHY3_APHAT|nr:hypothetical protein H257_07332 [Aphanomyces astaci]ETV79277.1 hypothetical protein H257_07332 [Aphanomyces astaci]|eukprot:XP_009831118.1 hypothetical protein H257_07332 [Aphanomyces astaci]
MTEADCHALPRVSTMPESSGNDPSRDEDPAATHMVASASTASIISITSEMSVAEKDRLPLASHLAKAAQTGASNFVLAYNVRAGIALLSRIVQLIQNRKFRDIVNLNSLLSEKHLNFRVEAVSMGLFIGCFTGGYEALQAVLRKLRPDLPAATRTVVSGIVAGSGILCLNPSRRRSLALYTFVRALQSVYNIAKARKLWHFWGSHWPHGDALLFGVASAQVMYSFILRPEILPKEYFSFIHRAGPVAMRVLQFTQRTLRGAAVEPADVIRFLDDKASPVVYNIAHNHPESLPCSLIHHGSASCTLGFGMTFWNAARRTFPLYLSLNIVPRVVLDLHRFVKAPVTTVLKGTWGGVRSTAFLGTFVALYQATVCVQRLMFRSDSKATYFVAGLIASGSILLEAKHRRSELALYVLPRALDLLYITLRDKRVLAEMAYGEVMLFACSMGTLMFCFEHEKQHLSPFVERLLNRFLHSTVKSSSTCISKS